MRMRLKELEKRLKDALAKMERVLLDTSVLIDFLRREDKDRSLLIEVIRRGCSLSISLITHTELYAGKSVWQKKQARRELETLLSGLEIIIPNLKVSELAGKIRANYQVNLLDALIAAEAITSRLPLVTLNLKDFKKIKGVKIFRSEGLPR